jgi:hypothetical protein
MEVPTTVRSFGIRTTIHENDGDFRHHYMGELLIHFKIKVKHHDNIPAAIKKKSMDDGVWRDSDEDLGL